MSIMIDEKKRITPKINLLLDKRLYGSWYILMGLGYLLMGLFLNILIFYKEDLYRAIIYSIIYFGAFLITGLFSKNVGRKQFHFIGWEFSVLFFLISLFAKGFMILTTYGRVFPPFFELALIGIITEAGFLISLISIVVKSQRISLRNSLGLVNDIFNRNRKIWENKLTNFPNYTNILKEIEQIKIVIELFDWGFFNLVILWSCNTMEQIIEAVKKQLISIDPNNRTLFLTEEGDRIRFSKILNNLGFSYNDESGFNEKKLWHDIRNDITHRNKIPSYKETESAIKLLISFLNEMPDLLIKYSIKEE